MFSSLVDRPPQAPRRTYGRQQARGAIVGALAAGGIGTVCASMGLLGPALLIGAVGAASIASLVLWEPRLGVLATIAVSIFGLGVKRYIPVPMGLSVDLLLALTWVSVLVGARHRVDWSRANQPVVWATAVWMIYVTLELLNPLAHSRIAWAYAMRGIALYMTLMVPLVVLIAHRRADLDRFLHLWLILSALGTVNGLRQKFVGVDPFEQQWLNQGAAVQHVLFGKLRIFSFYSDAGQCGAAQGHMAVVAGIIAIGPSQSWTRRLMYGAASVLGLVGLFISGTRGAVAVPFFGGVAYLILSRDWRSIGLGGAAMVAAYLLLMYTWIGSGVYEIQRVRMALKRGADTPSMQVRLENQRRLARFMRAHPVRYAIGGGVGSVGSWGRRFSPGTFLAEFPPDSWYVRIWAETGTIGLLLHLLLWMGIMGYTGATIWTLHDPALRQKMIALHAGVMGILVASYGNQVLGQMPTGMMVYASVAFLAMAPRLDRASPDAPSTDDTAS